MRKEQAIRWLVELCGTSVQTLLGGRPGDLPNLIFDMRQWLGLEDTEPLNRELRRIERSHNELQAIIDELGKLVDAVADRKKVRISYQAGGVILDASRLGTDGPRALSYRDASLRDAVLRVALDDIYESAQEALLIRRWQEQKCQKVFLAARRSQVYCSRACANTHAGLVYRERHRDNLNTRERQRYAKKMRPAKVRHRVETPGLATGPGAALR